jgi:DHA3 family macrolide efflux protein-like MFS transporter
VDSIPIRNRMRLVFFGEVILGIGFLLLAASTTLPLALLGSAFAALGGPLGDIALSVTIQTELPVEQIGKVSSLNMLLSSVGASLGLSLAIPLFSHFDVWFAISLCAIVMLLTGLVGMVYIGWRKPDSLPSGPLYQEI